MTGIVMHYQKCKPGSTLASARIARWLCGRYGFDLMDEPYRSGVENYRDLEDLPKVDYAFVVSSASGFADPDFREQVGWIAAHAGQYVFVQNDYMTSQAGQIGKHFDLMGKARSRIVWSTIPSQCKSTRDAYINWNRLTWRPQPRETPTHFGLLYYGALRRERIKYFKRYFSGDVPYLASISTSTRVSKKWKEFTAENVRLIEPFDDVIVGMQDHQMSIYLEDEKSHRHFHSLANRFYECLSAQVPMAIDVSCRGSFGKAGLTFDDSWITRQPRDVVSLLERSDEVAELQQRRWSRDYMGDLVEDVSKAERNIGL